MTVGKLSIEQMGADHTLAIINCDNGDHFELSANSWNHARHRAEDFSQSNQIVFKEKPHREGYSFKSGFNDPLKQYRF